MVTVMVDERFRISWTGLSGTGFKDLSERVKDLLILISRS
jgi:hypothetical protein